MTNPLPWSGRIALLVVLPAALLPLLLAGPRSTVPAAQPSRQSRFHDWTTHHVLYPHYGTMSALEAARNDPRALFRWHEVQQRELAERQARWLELQPHQLENFLRFPRHRIPPGHFPTRSRAGMHTDWSINLGTAGTANAMYPAKFTFDTTAPVMAPASCTNDFVVFPVNATSGGAQPNIAAFSNLYSGTAGANGICNRTPVALKDDGVSATVLWSYDVHAIAAGAAVPTSPVLSLDGKRVAFVESATGSAAHFHVLAWKAKDGQATNLQNALLPAEIKTFTDPSAPATGSGTATDLTFGTTTDTLSSPFIDYGNDLAYVGNDAGVVFRIKNVFCALKSCAASPTLDSTWGTAGAVTIGGTCTGASGRITGPVLDFVTMNIYVGCADGKIYMISQAGTIKSLAVGDGIGARAFGAIVDAPVVDGINKFVYVSSGSANNAANGVLVQAAIDLSSSVAVPIGAGNQCNLHAPTPNNAYFSASPPPTATSLIIIGGATGAVGPCTATGATGGTVVVYGATLKAGGVLNTGAPATARQVGTPGNEFAPFTEFFNSTVGGGSDLLFISEIASGVNIGADNINGGIPNGFTYAPVVAGFGASGIVVDNASASAQASSIYFNALFENAACTNNTGTNITPGTGGCAFKLTQAGLQ